MKQRIPKLALVYIACVVSFVFIAIALEYLLPIPKAGNVFKSNDVLKVAIEGRFDLAQTLISWALGLVGGLIVLLKFEVEGKLSVTQTHLSIIFVAAIGCFISTYFGHLYIDRMGLILSHQLNPFKDPYLGMLGFSQYLFLAISLILALTSYIVTFLKE